MRSDRRGKRIPEAEVTNISSRGFWTLLDDRELFLPFKKFPWFAEATVSEITGLKRPSQDHLYWPQLDVDLAVESIQHPERYPLVSRELSRLKRTRDRIPAGGASKRENAAKRRRG